MDKSNTNSEKIFDNNNKNIKTLEKLLQIKIIIFIHNSIFTYYSEVITRQYSNVKS